MISRNTNVMHQVKTNNLACDLCAGTDTHFLFKAFDRLHGCQGTFTYVKCRKCNLVYMNPQIAPDETIKFYPSDYAPHQLQSQRRKVTASRLPAFIRRKLTEESRLLDVGCGSGSFLNSIKTLTGCKVCGIDISKNAAKIANKVYNLDIFTGTIFDAPFTNNYFDVITAWSYLEHVNSPSAVLAKIYALLKINGILVLRTPNVDSFCSKIFKNKWYHLDCPRHLYLFSPQTLAFLLQKKGFLLRKFIYDPSSKGILGSLQYYFFGDNYNPEYRNRIKSSRLLKTFVSPLAKIAAVMKRSDTITVIAEKSD